MFTSADLTTGLPVCMIVSSGLTLVNRSRRGELSGGECWNLLDIFDRPIEVHEATTTGRKRSDGKPDSVTERGRT